MIDSLIKRYLFQIRTFSNGETTPLEVFFCDWIPDFLTIPTLDLTITSVVTHINEWNYLIISHKIQHDLPSLRNYVFRITFTNSNSAWANKLGYSSYNSGDRIPFPCYSTLGLSADPYINCDLIIGAGTSSSYIYVFGFAPLTQNTVIDIHLPKIKNGATTGADASAIFEVLEETWDHKLTYVTLYQKTIVVFTTQAAYTTGNLFFFSLIPRYNSGYQCRLLHRYSRLQYS